MSKGDNLAEVKEFFLSTTCDVDTCVSPNCRKATSFTQNNTSAVLTFASLPASGTFRVVGRWANGIWCNTKFPITFP